MPLTVGGENMTGEVHTDSWIVGFKFFFPAVN